MKIIKIIIVFMLVALLSFCKSTSNSNDKPNSPSNPIPADGSTNVEINTDLEWECTDPEGDALTYNVYLGTNPSPTTADLLAEDIAVTTFDPGTLGYLTTYYWKIIADDDQKGSTSSPIWSFTTPGFTEEFTGGHADNFIYQDARWGFNTNTDLTMIGFKPNTWANAYYDQEFMNYVVETRVGKVVSTETLDSPYGLFIRSNGILDADSKSSNGYCIAIKSNGHYGIFRYENGVKTAIVDWTFSLNVSYGIYGFTKIKVVANGSNFDIYFNDALTDSFDDDTFPAGYVVLTAWDSDEGDTELMWQYFYMSAPEAVK